MLASAPPIPPNPGLFYPMPQALARAKERLTQGEALE